jgi:serine/threonine protein kinase
MAPERWRQVESLYNAALARAPERRAAFLQEACQGDPELYREVESLLSRDASGDGLLERPAWEAAPSLMEEATRNAVTPGAQLGPYRIEASLGAGGMGQVFKARDSRLGRIVAVKVVHEQFSERFERESRAIASLNHPHICTLHDVGPNYLVMELLEGETLAARLKNGKLSIERTIHYGTQIADALGRRRMRRASFTAT